MKLSPLNVISPIDGRYRGKTKSLSKYFSEEALIQYRVRVEIEYFIALCEIPLPQLEHLNPSIFEDLRSIYKHFSEEDAKEIKEIEKLPTTMSKPLNILSKEFDKMDLGKYKEFIHFGLTSQDINNTAIPLSIKEAFAQGISSSFGRSSGGFIETFRNMRQNPHVVQNTRSTCLTYPIG